MRKYLRQIWNGVIVAVVVLLSFSFFLTVIEKLASGEIGMAIVFFSFIVLMITLAIKKVLQKKRNSK